MVIVILWDRQSHLIKDSEVSRTALCWIQRNQNWGTFIQNRVKEIRSLTSPAVWPHVPGTLKAADLVSSGYSGEQLLQEKLWEGTSWLLEDEKSWPISEGDLDKDFVYSELRKTIVTTLTNVMKTLIGIIVSQWVWHKEKRFPVPKMFGHLLCVDEVLLLDLSLYVKGRFEPHITSCLVICCASESQGSVIFLLVSLTPCFMIWVDTHELPDSLGGKVRRRKGKTDKESGERNAQPIWLPWFLQELPENGVRTDRRAEWKREYPAVT
ncbi:unnamed protein product [Larinioides sclopetarius]|uniref:Uncharacterized protein n=1 Tax=Larinioides sclopetarius TaxID=280406 RepID=A0AAV2AGA0_9ARAC